MAGLIDRIGSLAGTDLGKAVDLAHRVYQERMEVHNHTGRAILEAAAEVARNHPNLVGIGAGLLVEQFLSEQKRRHDVYLAELEGEAEAGALQPAPSAPAAPQPGQRDPRDDIHVPDIHVPLVHHDLIRLNGLRPGKIASEVFGALALLKLASSGVRWFRHDKQHEVWFGPAAKIRLWSGTIAAYYLVKSLKSPKLSAWRNAAIALFATDALKPVLNTPKPRRKTSQPSRSAAPSLTRPAAPFAPLAPPPAAEAAKPPAEPDLAPSSAANDSAARPAQHADADALH